MARRAVLFDLGGVLFGPGLQHFLGSLERDSALPRNFLQKVMLDGGSESPHAKVMRGQISLSQLFSEVEEGCRKHAAASAVPLPETFSIARAFESMAADGKLNTPLLQAAAVLRRNGFKTCVFTNSWVDDSAGRLFTAALMNVLRRHFDLVIESCRVGMQKPEPGMYRHALEVLQAQPQEVIFLDDIGENLKPAQQMGMATILVRDTETALKQLQELSGVQLLGQEETLPTACDPVNISHGYVPIRPGVQLHFVEMGHGPVVCLCHGFPESWLSWRYQIPALADAGFRVIALEMKGYGDSTAPPDIEEYSQEKICQDLAVFLDKLGIAQAVLIGHDWGGFLVWNMALFYPERVRAVASLNTPYRPADPDVDIVEKMRSIPTFDYQFYFQEPGVAEAELEKDISRTMKVVIRSVRQEDRLPSVPNFHSVQQRGGLLVGLPENPPASRILGGPALQYYVQQFTKSGFRGPLNWYRNMRPNWRWALSAKDRKITVPALMVTAGKDIVLHPSMSKGMEEWIPQLSRGHIEDCGHWTQMERPAELNKILLEWLEKLPESPSLPKISRL
ncbi:bifunctional epoxide hydrolase 2 [Dromaius novaehollandiae]|uniref:Epoxide hydrolase 2 n=1 Tax=Dromaius novaehollandiae TaxID=8790 RepID=A0A8C4J2T7_DRONO|nr:bifunctional epoxide hydrolase 2 isoform X3 [Dromaius novaehollandiae]